MGKYLYAMLLAFFFLSITLTIFFGFQIRERNKYIDDLINITVSQNSFTDIDRIAIRLSEEIYRRTNKVSERSDLDFYSSTETFSFFNMTSAVSLEHGTYGVFGHRQLGPCGTMSRTLLNALWRLDIPARKLHLRDNERGEGGGHTMIEFYFDGQWRALSPSDNSFVWRNHDGTIATARDIRKSKEVFSQIFDEDPDFQYLFDNFSNNIRWEKLPLVIRTLIRRILGEERYNSVHTPKLYDLPRNLFLLASISSSMFFGLSAFVVRRRLHIRERRHGATI